MRELAYRITYTGQLVGLFIRGGFCPDEPQAITKGVMVRMEVRFDLISILTCIGVAFGIFLIAVILANRKGNLLANICFSVLLFILIFSICNSGIFYYTNLFRVLPHIIMVPMLLLPLVAPLFLIYVSLITQESGGFRAKWFLHFIPAIVYTAYQIPFLIQDGSAKIAYIERWLDNSIDIRSRIENFSVMFFIILQIIIYFIFILRHLSSFKAKLEEVYSTEKVDLSWIRRFIFANIFTFGVIGLFLAIMTIYGVPLKTVYRFLPLVVVVFICYLSFHAAYQSDISVGIDLSDLQQTALPPSSLKQSEIDRIADKLNTMMETEKPYLEPNLTLPDLARKVGVFRNQLSYVINNKFGDSFFDFINRYRVEEAKRIISEPNQSTFNMLNIGMNVGFSSKTAFNVNFKKFTNMPPSKYKIKAAGQHTNS